MAIFQRIGRLIHGAVSPRPLSNKEVLRKFTANFPTILLDNARNMLGTIESPKIENPQNLQELNGTLLDHRPLASDRLKPKTKILQAIKRLAETLDTEKGISLNIIFIDGSLKLATTKDKAGLDDLVDQGTAERALDSIGISYYTMKRAGSPYRELTPPRGVQRVQITTVSSQPGDKPDMIPLQGTEGFNMGSEEYPDERPIREVRISPFKISRDPITNAQYKKYLEATDQPVPPWIADPRKQNYPATRITWLGFIKYYNWLSGEEGLQEVYVINEREHTVTWQREKNGYRFLTEAERELAARGQKGRKYPWEGEFDESKVVSSVGVNKASGPEAVNSPTNIKGATPEGIRGLAGNVGEWVWDEYSERGYDPEDLDNPIGVGGNIASSNSGRKGVRGGWWDIDVPRDLRGADRSCGHPGGQNDVLGSRAARA